MYDYPELFHQQMKRLADGYIEYFQWMEREGLLLPTTGPALLNQGSYCFTRELPEQTEGLTLRDVWGFEDSQETSGISAEMYGEFNAPRTGSGPNCVGSTVPVIPENLRDWGISVQGKPGPVFGFHARYFGEFGRIGCHPWF